MRCVMCGRKEKSNPKRQTDWRCLECDGRPMYVCPIHLPKDGGASRKAFTEAYQKIMEIRN